MMWWHNGMGWGGWIVMTLTLVAFWSLVVFVVIAIFRGDSDSRPGYGAERPTPSQILDERFARGDIGVDEYHARLETLRSSQALAASDRPGGAR